MKKKKKELTVTQFASLGGKAQWEKRTEEQRKELINAMSEGRRKAVDNRALQAKKGGIIR